VDWPTARRAVQNDERLLRLVVEACLEDYPRLLADLRQAVETGDPKALAQAAHAIKGSIRTFGETKAFALAYELETMGRAGDVSLAAAVFQAAEGEFERLLAVLQEFLQGRI
jgi:HPt (histidine-containing phosphotransfer) domain-containing protein